MSPFTSALMGDPSYESWQTERREGGLVIVDKPGEKLFCLISTSLTSPVTRLIQA